MSEQHEAVAVEVHDAGWAELILNRPERKNAITGPLGEAMAAAMHELNSNDDVRVIIVRCCTLGDVIARFHCHL